MPGATGAERPFIGRPEAVDALRRRSDAARGGRGGLTLIEGEAGVGKTTLVDGLIRDARSKGLRVLSARAPSLENPPPFHLIREALGSRRPGSDEPVRSLPPLAVIPTALRGGGEDGEGRGAEAWRDSELASDLLSEGEDAPTVVVLEDVHLADEGSLATLSILAPQLLTHPLWVVLTRLPLAGLPGPRRARLETIERTGDAETVVLRPFSLAEATEFVRSVDRSVEVRDEEVTRWYSQSGGNPLFLEQLARRRRGVRPEPPARPRRSPEEFAEFLAAQVAGLTAEQDRVLAVASILGREFPFALLLRASGDDEEALAELVQELVARGLLRERPEEILEFLREDL
ncbi:MAG: AAA family ATPase, partial [Thermoplasmata archaeon]|nr:AAA family ATPase [Thermoplasmata archaeon]